MLRKTVQLAFLIATSAAALTAIAALDDELRSDFEVTTMLDEIVAACPGASPLVLLGPGDAELAMLREEQEIAPMVSFLSPDRTCLSAAPEDSQGLIVALDTVLVTTAQESDQCPSDGIVHTGCIVVSDLNEVPGLQCTDCDTPTEYCFEDALDALRILFSGMHQDAGGDAARRDCNSDVRHSLIGEWDALFPGSCAPGECTELAHAWRLEDRARVTSTFLSLLDLPPIEGVPFCNGNDDQDLDPIRRPCAPEEIVCQLDGTGGLVLPVQVPELSAGEASVAYPSTPCVVGQFSLAPAERLNLSGGGTRFNCPEREDFSIAGFCLAPQAANGGFDCVSPPNNPNVFFSSLSDDARAFNRFLRREGGDLVANATAKGPLVNAWHRTRTDACSAETSEGQVGCLSGEIPCSLGFSNRVAIDEYPQAQALSVGGLFPTEENVRLQMLDPAPKNSYPLARPVFINTMVGFEHIDDPKEDALAQCSFDPALIDAAAESADFYTLGRPPRCRDFDETSCNGLVFPCDTDADCGSIGACVGGNPQTRLLEGSCDDSCATSAECSQGRSCILGRCDFSSNSDTCSLLNIGSGINFCPSLDFVFVSPLSTSVGGTISVQASASDFDGDQVGLTWFATEGSFDNPLTDSTLYHCDVPGSHTLTLTYDDGRCTESETIQVQCVATTD